MYQAWDEFDHAIEGLSADEATTREHGGSAIAWTAGHVANTVDALISRRFLASPPHPVVGRARFATGGSGEAADWQAILQAVAEVRETARRSLDSNPDLDLAVHYDGSVAYLRESGLTLRYALMAVAAHHFLHAGEVITLRSLLGNPAGDCPNWGQNLV